MTFSSFVILFTIFMGLIAGVATQYKPEAKHPSCTTNHGGLTSCNFNNGFCAFQGDSKGGLSWKRGTTVTDNKGETIKNGWEKKSKPSSFVYLDVTDPNIPVGSKARLSGAVTSPSIKAVCINLHYATTSGNGVPSFTVYNINHQIEWTPQIDIGTVTDDTKGEWKVARFHSCVGSMSHVVIESEKIGSGSLVALDYIEVTQSTMDCPIAEITTSGTKRPTTPSLTTLKPTTTTASSKPTTITKKPTTNGSALRVSTSPDPFMTLIHDTLNITCTTDGLASWVEDIMFIEIGKLGENPIAMVRKQKLVMGSTRQSNMRAEGQIVSNVSQCYLTVTINKPSFKEAGTYVCKSYYLDQQYQIEEAVMPINVTIGEVDTTAVLTHLSLKIKVQEDHIREQKRELDAIKEKESRQYAFSNRFNWDKDAFNKGETLRFSDTITNIGNAYNATTGLFTVPCDGVYVFFVVVLTRNIDDLVNISLLVNGSTVAKIVASGNAGQQASMNTVVSIKAGDIVQPYVNDFRGSDDIRSSYSYFSGFLLHAM